MEQTDAQNSAPSRVFTTPGAAL